MAALLPTIGQGKRSQRLRVIDHMIRNAAATEPIPVSKYLAGAWAEALIADGMDFAAVCDIVLAFCRELGSIEDELIQAAPKPLVGNAKLPIKRAGIIDGRYAVCTGYSGVYDIAEGKWADMPPMDRQTRSYNLTTMMLDILKDLEAHAPSLPSPSPASVDKS